MHIHTPEYSVHVVWMRVAGFLGFIGNGPSRHSSNCIAWHRICVLYRCRYIYLDAVCPIVLVHTLSSLNSLRHTIGSEMQVAVGLEIIQDRIIAVIRYHHHHYHRCPLLFFFPTGRHVPQSLPPNYSEYVLLYPKIDALFLEIGSDWPARCDVINAHRDSWSYPGVKRGFTFFHSFYTVQPQPTVGWSSLGFIPGNNILESAIILLVFTYPWPSTYIYILYYSYILRIPLYRAHCSGHPYIVCKVQSTSSNINRNPVIQRLNITH